MKFASVDGERQEAQPGLSGECPACESPMVAKCGEFRAWHWAHRGRRHCDPWWENETEWHRNWKNRFQANWQEIVHPAEDGGQHIADVKTGDGWVIEFQHSHIKPDERRSREAFYPNLVWVIDGLRRKRDKAQFLNAWKEGAPIGGNLRLRRVSADQCVLLREWAESSAPVFFDFGRGQDLAWLLPKKPGGTMYVTPLSREVFVGIHRATATQVASNFHSFVEQLGELVAKYESHHRARSSMPIPPRPLRRSGQRRIRPRRRL